MAGLSLSIVTPSFNTARFLPAAIDSVLSQDWPGLQYVVMDGNSADGTIDILRGYGSRIDWVSAKDQGQTDALNKGFARLGGDVLGWLNSDDTYAPGAFRAATEFLEAHPDVALVYGDANFIGAAGDLIGPCVHIEPYSRRRLFHYSDFIVQPAAFFRRSAFEAVGGLDASLNWGMDYDLWLKLAAKFKIAYLPRTLANYRWVKGNKSSTGGFRRVEEIRRILARHGKGLPAYNRLERVNLRLEAARGGAGNLNFGRVAGSLIGAAVEVLRSPRAMVSLFQPRTWKIIWTGQVLRKRALERNDLSATEGE